MPAFGRSLFDLDQLTEETDLDRLLAHTRDLARLSKLLVLGLRFEEHTEAPRDYNDDWDLLHSALWPLERACERAIELEGDAGVAPANVREENRRPEVALYEHFPDTIDPRGPDGRVQP